MASAVRLGLLPTELEYLATEATEVEIVPTFASKRVRLLDRNHGPFNPPATAKVTLWIAVNLKAKKKCRIVPPSWLTVESLREAYDQEIKAAPFAQLPPDYAIIAKILLEVAPGDIPDSDLIRGLLKDLREARQAKIISGLSAVNSTHLEMTNVTSLEICELRPFFTRAVNHLRAIESNSAGDEEQANTGGDTTGGTGAEHTFTFDDRTMD